VIRSLRLQNFKCFEDQSLELASFTLLSGLNGMGKSSVLQALLLLRQSYQQGLLQKTGLALNGDILRLGTARDALFEGAEEEKIGFDLILRDGKEGKWRFNYNREADVMDLASPSAASEVFDSSLFGDDFHYLQAERIGPRTSFEMSDFLVRQHRQLGTRGEYTAHFLSVFGRDDIPNVALSHQKSESSKLRDQVEAWVGEVSPGTRLHFTPHAGMDLVNLQYSFVTGQQVSNSYRSTNVGFGITYTLPILVAILSSRSGALLLLENPEAHLHPKGQVSIGDLMAHAASCGVQIVVETHSDHILNGIRLAVHAGRLHPDDVRLHFFERWGGDGPPHNEIVSPRIDRNGRIDQWPAGFFDEWDKSIEALLEPRDI
jgi:predicted ATPase